MGMSNDAMKAEKNSVYGSHAPKYWRYKFKRGRTSVFDKDRPGRPKDVTTDEMVEKIHDIVLDNGKIKLDWKKSRKDVCVC